MTIPAKTVCHTQLIYGFTQTQHEHQICGCFSILELYSSHCSHHRSLCPLFISHLAFLHSPCFTSMHYCWPYIAPINSPFQLYWKSATIHQFITLHRPSPPTSCSGSYNNITSSTCTLPVTKICEFLYCFLFVTYLLLLLICLSNIPFTLSACTIPLKHWSHPFHSGTSTMDPPTTLCTQY